MTYSSGSSVPSKDEKQWVEHLVWLGIQVERPEGRGDKPVQES